jgi:acyl-CoA thioester hydrolase
VTRHEIDYRGNVALGDSVTGRTWIEKPPRGATFDRRVEFVNGAGKVIVSANTTWAMLDRASGRLIRVPAEVAAPFLGRDQAG